MANSQTPITVESLAPILYKDHPVLTTSLLAKFYGTTPGTIRHNLNYHRDRFIDGTHCFSLKGQELRDFKDCVRDSVAVGKSLNTNTLTLYTARGSARHAKMLDTDQAWEVFEKLEDCYFNRTADKPKPEPKVIARRTTAQERNPLAVMVNRYLGKLGPSRSNYTSFWRRTFHPVFGVNSVEELTIDQLPKAMAFMEALLAASDSASVPAPKALPPAKERATYIDMLMAGDSATAFSNLKDKFMPEVYEAYIKAAQSLKTAKIGGPSQRAAMELLTIERHDLEACYNAACAATHAYERALFRVDRLVKIAGVL